uniref:DDE Tnp4 domain-containing protein n=1 Tax=Romanomermis culicivorax TaxID=13658 RepID=A0A915JWM4_ROMCU
MKVLIYIQKIVSMQMTYLSKVKQLFIDNNVELQETIQLLEIHHKEKRMVVERLNGILKRRFPCLSTLMRFSPKKCCILIVACAVLHNYAHRHNDLEKDEDDTSTSVMDEEFDN